MLVAHGPVSDEENKKWLADMSSLAEQQVKRKGQFRDIRFMTVRDDAPAPVRDQATAGLRQLIESIQAEKRRVLVVPPLLSYGGIELTLFRPALNRLLFLYQNIAEARTTGVEFDGNVNLTRGFYFGGAYTCLSARKLKAQQPLAGRHKHQGNIRLAWENNPRLGLRWNLRGTFYSKWINTFSTVTTNTQGAVTITPDVIPPGFMYWDCYLAKRIHRGLEFFGAVDHFTDSRDPNVGKLSATGTPLAIYRTELGRTFRLGMRFTWAGERK